VHIKCISSGIFAHQVLIRQGLKHPRSIETTLLHGYNCVDMVPRPWTTTLRFLFLIAAFCLRLTVTRLTCQTADHRIQEVPDRFKDSTSSQRSPPGFTVSVSESRRMLLMSRELFVSWCELAYRASTAVSVVRSTSSRCSAASARVTIACRITIRSPWGGSLAIHLVFEVPSSLSEIPGCHKARYVPS